MDRKIILVQHCQAEHHTNGMIGSWTDTELTDLGRRQAARVATRISTLTEGSEDWMLISSDLKRCTQTAALIRERCSKEPRLEPDLREINLGEAVGKSQVWLGETNWKSRRFRRAWIGSRIEALRPGESFTSGSIGPWTGYTPVRTNA